MSESAQHQKLVKTIIEYVETIVGKDKKCFITSDAADGMNISPLTAEGFRPDVFYQYDDVLIQNYKSYAHPQDGVVVYKISYKGKSLVYATDKESYLGGDKKLADFARGCNLLIHDAQYTTEDYQNQFSPKQGYGHSTFDMAVEVQRQTGAEQLVFFHLDPTYNDEKLNRIKNHYESQFSVKMAFEGLELDLIQ